MLKLCICFTLVVCSHQCECKPGYFGSGETGDCTDTCEGRCQNEVSLFVCFLCLLVCCVCLIHPSRDSIVYFHREPAWRTSMESLTASVLEVSPERTVNQSLSLPTLLAVRISINRKLSPMLLFPFQASLAPWSLSSCWFCSSGWSASGQPGWRSQRSMDLVRRTISSSVTFLTTSPSGPGAESAHGANGVNFYYGAPAPYAESIAPSHHSTYAHYYDDEEDGWDMPNFYNEVCATTCSQSHFWNAWSCISPNIISWYLHQGYMKQGLAGAEKGHSLGRSQGSLYGNKEELYDRLKRHAYQPGQGKKGEWYILWMFSHKTHPPFFRQEQCKRDDKWFWRCSSVKRIHVRRLPGVSVVARMLHRCL